MDINRKLSDRDYESGYTARYANEAYAARQAEQAAGFRQEYPEQAARPNRSRSRRRRSRERTARARSRSPGKHGKGGNKGKSKAQPKQRVDTSRWLTEVDGSEICRNWNLSLCSRTKCARAHICAICRGPHRATDKAHH